MANKRNNLFLIFSISYLASCLFLKPFSSNEIINPLQINSAGTILTTRGGASDEPTQQSVKTKLSIQVPKQEQVENMPDVKVKEASPFSGERIRYSPNGNGGGNDDPSSCSDEWICPKIPKPSEVISDEYFWTTLQKGSDFYDDEEDSDDDICSPELSSQSNLRRRLLEVPGPTPTGKLDLPNQKILVLYQDLNIGIEMVDKSVCQISHSKKLHIVTQQI